MRLRLRNPRSLGSQIVRHFATYFAHPVIDGRINDQVFVRTRSNGQTYRPCLLRYRVAQATAGRCGFFHECCSFTASLQQVGEFMRRVAGRSRGTVIRAS